MKTQIMTYSYPILCDYLDVITDIDDRNKRVRIKYSGIESEGRLTVNEFEAIPVDRFLMSDEDVTLSAIQGMFLIDPKIDFQI